MFNEFETLEIDNTTGAGQTTEIVTNRGTEKIAVNSFDITSSFNTKRDSLPLLKPRTWEIVYSGITSGSGKFTLQFTTNGGISWNTAVTEDTGTAVEITVTGTQSTPDVIILEKGSAKSYRMKYVNTDVAGADAKAIVYVNGGV